MTWVRYCSDLARKIRRFACQSLVVVAVDVGRGRGWARFV